MTAPLIPLNSSLISRLRNSLAHGINNEKHLPDLIMVILDQGTYRYADAGDRIIGWLVDEYIRCFKTRHDQLNLKCEPAAFPYVLFVKPLPSPLTDPSYEMLKDTRRKINHALDRVIKANNNYDFDAINVNSFLRKDLNLYRKDDLTGQGYMELWNYLDDYVEAHFGMDNRFKHAFVSTKKQTKFTPRSSAVSNRFDYQKEPKPGSLGYDKRYQFKSYEHNRTNYY